MVDLGVGIGVGDLEGWVVVKLGVGVEVIGV